MKRISFILVLAIACGSFQTPAMANSRLTLPSDKKEDYDLPPVDKQLSDIKGKRDAEIAATADPNARRMIQQTYQPDIDKLNARRNEVIANLRNGKLSARRYGMFLGQVQGTSAGVEIGTQEGAREAEETARRDSVAKADARISDLVAATVFRKALIQTVETSPAQVLSLYSGAVVAKPSVFFPPRIGVADEKFWHPMLTKIAAKFATSMITNSYRERLEAALKEGQAIGAAEGEASAKEEIPNIVKESINNTFFDPAKLNRHSISVRQEVQSRTFAGAINFQSSPYYKASGPFPHEELLFAFREGYELAFMKSAAKTYDEARAQAIKSLYPSYLDRFVSEIIMAKKDALNTTATGSLYAEYTKTLQEFLAKNLSEQLQKHTTEEMTKRLVENKEKGRQQAFDMRKAQLIMAAVHKAQEETEAQLKADWSPEVVAVSTLDANEDTVYAPGEGASVTVVVRNYAFVEQKADLTAVIENGSDGLKIENNTDLMPKIPARSETTLKLAAPFFVKADTAAGTDQKLVLRLNIDGKPLSIKDLHVRVSYPYEFVDSKFPAYTRINDNGFVKVRLKNVSSKPSAAPVSLAISPDTLARYDVTSEYQPRILAPGQEVETFFVVTPKDESAFQYIPMVVLASENDWTLGRAEGGTESTDTARSLPDSHGVFVVSNKAQGQLARKTISDLGMSFDIFDARAESQKRTGLGYSYGGLQEFTFSELKTLGPAKFLISFTPIETLYLSKSRRDRDALRKNFSGVIYSGGTLLELVADSKDTLDLSNLRPRQIPFEGVNGGVLKFGQQRFFEVVKVKKKVTEDEEGGSKKTTIEEVEEIQMVQKPGIYLSLTTDGLSDETRKNVVAMTEILGLPFEQKIARYVQAVAAKNEANARYAKTALISDISAEMSDDEAMDIAGLRTMSPNLVLSKYVAAVAAANGDDRKTLLKLFPEISKLNETVLKDHSNFFNYLWHRERAIKNILEPVADEYEKFEKKREEERQGADQ